MTGPDRSAVIHGHFYQPPRDDPWLEAVDAQPSAAPFHDWNHRVTQECYRAVVAARISGRDGRIEDIVNTLDHISFNFGPTLLEWLEAHDQGTYEAILGADARSARNHQGHGNAVAQAYHHSILPLASRREKETEVRWGIADFKNRFGRNPAGMWLPETAVDRETLEVLAQEGIAFTILAPHQVEDLPPGGLPGRYRTAGGKDLAIFFYDGALSHGIAFGSLLDDARSWARAMTQDRVPEEPDLDSGEGEALGEQRLVSVATDGETYGHHHRFGEMALARVLRHLENDPGVRVENFASFLARHSPEHDVTLVEPTSWSCVHGVERWRADCGCRLDSTQDTQQGWRTGLRDAVEWLSARLHQVFEIEGGSLLGDPWRARDHYGPSGGELSGEIRALELLEMERQVLRMFTSCGWFFDDLAGLEPRQILRYAARALDLAGPGTEGLEEGFLARLDGALSNEAPPRSGRTIYLEDAKPDIPAPVRVAGGAALWDAIPGPRRVGEGGGPPGHPWIPGYQATSIAPRLYSVTHRRTGRSWDMEAQVLRPSLDQGAVSVREAGTRSPFLALELRDLPEPYAEGIRSRLVRVLPDPGAALMDALAALEGEPSDHGVESDLQDRVRQVRDLADLHLLLGRPIPFDAQTRFFRIFQAAPPSLTPALAQLRKPLGFTPLSTDSS